MSLFLASILPEHGLTKEKSNQLVVAYFSYLTTFRMLWWTLPGLVKVSSFKYSKCPFTAVTRYPWIAQFLFVSTQPFWLMYIHTSIFLHVIWQLLAWNMNSASPAAVQVSWVPGIPRPEMHQNIRKFLIFPILIYSLWL